MSCERARVRRALVHTALVAASAFAAHAASDKNNKKKHAPAATAVTRLSAAAAAAGASVSGAARRVGAHHHRCPFLPQPCRRARALAIFVRLFVIARSFCSFASVVVASRVRSSGDDSGGGDIDCSTRENCC